MQAVIESRRADQFNVSIEIVSCAIVAGRDHGMRIEIDSADEGSFVLGAGIDQPGFLMLAETWVSAIPADLHP